MALINMGGYGMVLFQMYLDSDMVFYAMALLHGLFNYNVCKSFPVVALIIMR